MTIQKMLDGFQGTYAGVNVTECWWEASVDDAFVTGCLLRRIASSACVISTLCGWFAVPRMSRVNVLPAVICALVSVPVWPWLAVIAAATSLTVGVGAEGLSLPHPDTVITHPLNTARADCRVNSRRLNDRDSTESDESGMQGSFAWLDAVSRSNPLARRECPFAWGKPANAADQRLRLPKVDDGQGKAARSSRLRERPKAGIPRAIRIGTAVQGR